MRTIGVIGGMSWESTAEYYRLLNEIVADRLGELRSADLIVRSLDFASIEAMQVAGERDRAGALLADEAGRLLAAGAEILVLATNTLHKIAGSLEETYGDRFIHLGDATAREVLVAGVERVGLLGTGFTLSQEFYRDRLAGHGLDVVVPGKEDQGTVHRVIHDELGRGVFTEASRQEYADVVGRLVDDGSEGVILGCTEIELLLREPKLHGVPLFPRTRIHAHAAVAAALA